MSLPASPCTGLCRLDAARAACLGCGRTVAEITIWPQADAARRLAILERLRREGPARPPAFLRP